MKIGIIGGVSPYACSKFYNNLCHEYRKKTGCYPELLIYSIFVSKTQESEFINNNLSINTIDKIVVEINKACLLFKENNIETVTICCNTLSNIFEEVAKKYDFKNIITPANSIKQYVNFQKCLVLSTEYTNYNIYTNFIKLNKDDQLKLKKFIEDKINDDFSNIDLNKIIESYDYDCIILGCTDINKNDLKTNKLIIDSNDCLLQEVVRIIGV